MYKVQGIAFENFEAMVQWVWDRYRIEFEGDWEYMSEAECQAACTEICNIITTLEEENADG